MLAIRCYPLGMAKEEQPTEMTPFGKAVWGIIQSRGRYSQAAIGRKIGEVTGWSPSRQAINHWLYGTRDVPRDFVPALAKAFDLTFEERGKLKDLYFYGQGDNIEGRFGREPGEEDLPGGARSPSDLREGLDAAARARRRQHETTAEAEGEDGRTDRDRGA
jgi:hypothetical protein